MKEGQLRYGPSTNIDKIGSSRQQRLKYGVWGPRRHYSSAQAAKRGQSQPRDGA